ncbi:MAG: Flp pilus assembly protein CpaB [Phycisphaerales bacterium]|jgi:pilus assembly protein CpaB|nr:Flp pilus assembly protein CpaB [Phycisphaerales bacterium]
MNIKAIVPLIVALVLGLVAALTAWQMTNRQGPKGTAQKASAQVVVLKDNVTPGAELRPESLVMGPAGSEKAPAGTFTSVEQVAGRVSTVPMVAGQPVFETLLAPKGTGSGLQALVPAGMRAITVEVNEFSGVAGLLAPGCRVDIVMTMQGEHSGESIARTICQDIKVTAVGQQVGQEKEKDDDKGMSRSVTLLVTPRDAEAIELGASMGRPRLVLRGSQDKELEQSAGVTLAELRGDPQKQSADPFVNRPVEQVRPATQPSERMVDNRSMQRTRTVQIIRAGNVSTMTFEMAAPEAVTRVPLDR